LEDAQPQECRSPPLPPLSTRLESLSSSSARVVRHRVTAGESQAGCFPYVFPIREHGSPCRPIIGCAVRGSLARIGRDGVFSEDVFTFASDKQHKCPSHPRIGTLYAENHCLFSVPSEWNLRTGPLFLYCLRTRRPYLLSPMGVLWGARRWATWARIGSLAGCMIRATTDGQGENRYLDMPSARAHDLASETS
jgi:hypothetical protein